MGKMTAETELTIKELLQKFLIPIAIGLLCIIWSQVQTVRDDNERLEKLMLSKYLTKDEYSIEKSELKQEMRSISDKIDRITDLLMDKRANVKKY